jgi:RHS repeat-associated protein
MVNYDDAMRAMAARTEVANAPLVTIPATAGATALLTTTPTEFVELARALKNDPDLIYEFVYDNIETLPQYGSLKGALGALIDRKGTAFDQAELLQALLIQAAITNHSIASPQIQVGQVWFTQAQLSNWTGADNQTNTANVLLGDGSFPGALFPTTGTLNCVRVGWAWVEVTVSGQKLEFDPAGKMSNQVLSDLQAENTNCQAPTTPQPPAKGYIRKTGISLATATGYSRSGFAADAVFGATVTDRTVLAINRTRVRADLTTYSNNLASAIRANPAQPLATADVIGGKSINPLPLGTHQQWMTVLPYAGSTPTAYDTLPASFRNTLMVTVGTTSITFNSSDIYGHRLVLDFLTGSATTCNPHFAAFLALDGAAQTSPVCFTATGQVDLAVSIHHPNTTGSTTGDLVVPVNSGAFPYLIATAWGGSSRNMVERHRKLLLINQASGASDTSDAVMGESLSVLGYTWEAELTKSMYTVDQIAGTETPYRHAVGIVGYKPLALSTANAAPFVDLPLNNVGVVQLVGRPSSLTLTPLESASFFTTAGMLSVLESGSIEQTEPGNTAVSTVKLLDQASQTDTIWDINNNDVTGDDAAYWTATIKPMFFAPNYNATPQGTADLMRIDGLVIAPVGSTRVIAAQHGPQTINKFRGDGYFSVAQDGTFVASLITGGLGGGAEDNIVSAGDVNAQTAAAQTATACPDAGCPNVTPNPATTSDPVNLVTGAFLNDHADIAVGSGRAPYSLTLSRHYDSSQRFLNNNATGATLGLGWTHNFSITALADSDGFQGFGEDSPISGASAIATIFVLQDIFNNQTDNKKPIVQMVMGVQTERWLMDQLTGNVVNVNQGGTVEEFVRLADGTYKEPLGSSASLTENLTTTAYTYTTFDQTVLTFIGATPAASAGKIATMHFRAGPTITWSYDNGNGGRLGTVTNGMGRTLTFHYGGAAVTSITDGASRSVAYTYTSGNLNGFTDAESNKITYVVDGSARLTQIFYPLSLSHAIVTNTYNGLDQVTTQVDANGNGSALYFAGSRTEIDNALLAQHINYFTSRAKTLFDIDALGNITAYTYDGIDRLTQTTQPEGNSISFAYSNAFGGSGARVFLQDVTGLTTTAKPGSALAPLTQSLIYDPACGRPTSSTDADHNTTTAVYDPTACTLTEVDQPIIGGVQPKTSFTYSARGQVLTKTDAVGMVTTYIYSTSNETLTSANEDSLHTMLKTQYLYNAVGDITSLTDPNLNITTSAYDHQRRLTQITGPTATHAQTVNTYDVNGQLVTVQRATGLGTFETSTATYSPTGKRLTATDPNNNTTTWTYDALDRVATVKDSEPVPRVTTYAYDADDRTLSVTNAAIQAAPLTSNIYSANGKRISLTDALGNTSGFVFDGFDRLVQTQYPMPTAGAHMPNPSDADTVTSYDGDGNPLSVTARDGTILNFTYDVLNRRTAKLFPSGVNDVYYTYYLDGRMKSALFGTASGPGTLGVAYTYDTAGRLLTENTNGRTLTYAHDSNGNLTRMTWPDAAFVAYTYDPLNRALQVQENGATSGPGLLAVYAYDALSRRTGLTRGNLTSATYGFDPGDRLTSLAQTMTTAGSAANVTFTLGYSNASQITSRARTNDTYGWSQSTPATIDATYSGLNQDNTVAHPVTYDGRGNVTADGVHTVTYDPENRATTIQNSSLGTTSTLSYDPLGRLQQDQALVGGVTTTTIFLYSGPRLVGEYNTSGAVQRRYVHGPGTDEPLVWYEGSGLTDRRWLHADERGSIVAWSDSSGVAQAIYTYSAYGETANWTGSRFRYAGQIALSEVQLYHYKARVYDPVRGRFLQTDPTGYKGGANLYIYVSDDPLNLVDPTGTQKGQAAAPLVLSVDEVNPANYATYSNATTRFTLSDPNHPTGMVIQVVTQTAIVWNDDTGLLALSVANHYAETSVSMWTINNGSIYTNIALRTGKYDDHLGLSFDDPLYFESRFGRNISGLLVIVVDAAFYPGMTTLPAGFGRGPNGIGTDPSSGNLDSTVNFSDYPNLAPYVLPPGGTNVVHRVFSVPIG